MTRANEQTVPRPAKVAAIEYSGEVVYLYAFDVANGIQTATLREVLGRRPVPLEIQIDHSYPSDVPLYRPLNVEAPPLAARLRGQPAPWHQQTRQPR